MQYREEAASSSRGRTKPASNYPLPPEIQKAFGQLDRGQKPLIRHLSRFAEDHPDDAIRCSLEDIATLPSGEKRSDIWRHPAVSAWLESLENPYRPWSLGGNGHGASNLKAFRTLLGHEDIDYQDVDKNMSVATIRFLSDERVSSRTKKYASIICHAAHFVENHPDPAIRCTLKDIVDFPGENGVWGNPSVLAWLDSKDNPYRLESEGGDGSGPVAIRALRRDFGKKDQ